MKKTKSFKFIIIILLLILLVIFILGCIIYFFNINAPKKEADKIINDFYENEQVFITIKDYFLNNEFDSIHVYVNKNNFSELILTDEEYECFNNVFTKLKLIRIVYHKTDHSSGYSDVVRFVYTIKFNLEHEMVYTGSNDSFIWNSSVTIENINLENGWHFNSYGGE
ncbi:MAG: hypothetical protein FWG70_02240 [Oscillospiraceae bacterium]|nr:hypothetical protein [Oscillospiraceae bacterium]